jgi:outer membrane protein OmpA-like peptidoglycan-associated protein
MKKCTWFLLLIPLWFLGSAYWYTCITKGLCKDMSLPGISIPSMSVPAITAITDTWNKVKAEPLTVYFAADSDNVLTEGVDEKLKNIVEYMKQNENAKISIAGHTNYHKDVVYTEKLGLVRAEKLKSLLVSYGAPAERISTVSKGQRETVAPYTDPEAHNKNRRAVLSIVE